LIRSIGKKPISKKLNKDINNPNIKTIPIFIFVAKNWPRSKMINYGFSKSHKIVKKIIGFGPQKSTIYV
jgi:hypothetical protein